MVRGTILGLPPPNRDPSSSLVLKKQPFPQIAIRRFFALELNIQHAALEILQELRRQGNGALYFSTRGLGHLELGDFRSAHPSLSFSDCGSGRRRSKAGERPGKRQRLTAHVAATEPTPAIVPHIVTSRGTGESRAL